MTFKAHHVGRFQQVSVVFRPVDIVAAIAPNAMRIHGALNEIIALHPVFVIGPVRKMSESRLPQCVIFEFPVVRQAETGAVTNRPVVSLPFDLLRKRLSLRVASNTSVIRGDIVHL